MSTPETESADICPICSNATLADVDVFVFECDDGMTIEIPPSPHFSSRICCVLTQAINIERVYVRLHGTDRVIRCTNPRPDSPIGTICQAAGRQDCKACGRTGKATDAMRRRMEGKWSPR